jgi:hypothetical protein
VHEAYIRLIGQQNADWQNRAHFFAVASNLMRRILVDYARRQLRAKRGGGQVKLSLEATLWRSRLTNGSVQRLSSMQRCSVLT